MSFRTFIIGLFASFGLAWFCVIILPYFKMKGLEPLEMEEADGTNIVYIPKRAGRVKDGGEVYGENGCYQCHTQLIRPTYAGNDMFRPDWAGLASDEDRGDTRRETNAFDFEGENYAHIGISRMGPDLSNLGVRVSKLYAKNISPEQWLFRHLYNPRWRPEKRLSTCPSFRFMFDISEVKGNRSGESMPFEVEEGMQIIPSSEARALVSYLLSLRKDQPVPVSLQFSPPTTQAPAAAAAPAPAGVTQPAMGEAVNMADPESNSTVSPIAPAP